jgi:hypothetical protein
VYPFRVQVSADRDLLRYRTAAAAFTGAEFPPVQHSQGEPYSLAGLELISTSLSRLAEDGVQSTLGIR